jgi:hypothetical protein
MMKSIKRMVLTGAAVMVMMSFAAPAMAAPLSDYTKASNPFSSYTDLLYTDVYKNPVETGGLAPPQPEVVGPAPTYTPQDNDTSQDYPHNRGSYRG